jgi:hypothetical protein
MLVACERDPNLLEELLRAPEAVAKRFDAQLAPEELTQIKRVATLRQVIDDFKVNKEVFRSPIFYPIDGWWRKIIYYHILRYPIFYTVFYPRGYAWRGGASDITARSGNMALQSASPVLDKWRWRFYPADALLRIDERINELTQAIQQLKTLRGGK